jgi:hypothetical protein
MSVVAWSRTVDWVPGRGMREHERVIVPRVRHSLAWQGRGDIDSVAIAPTGIAIAIETKTRSYDQRHLARAHAQVAWLSRRRQRWARNGALGVMCLVRARGVERLDEDVLVVSIDRLTHVLRAADRMCFETTVVSSSSSPQLHHSLGDRA